MLSCCWVEPPSKKWSQASSSVRVAMIRQERRRKVEQDRVTRAVQQGKWEDIVQRSLNWSDMWKITGSPSAGVHPFGLSFCTKIVAMYNDHRILDELFNKLKKKNVFKLGIIIIRILATIRIDCWSTVSTI